MSGITDDRAESAVEYIRDRAKERGQLKGQVEYLDHAIKIALAQAFLDAEGTVAEREARSRLDPEYQAKVQERADAVTELCTLETYLKAGELTIGVWQTQSANNRRGNI